MSVRKGSALGVVIVGLALVSQVAWADDGRPSRAVLEQMGLGEMTVLSDDQAASIRGLGYKSGSSVYVSGRSYARINLGPIHAGDSDDYRAHGKYEAKGRSFSITGIVITSGGHYGGGCDCNGPGHHGGKTVVKSIVVFAGGYSSAKAF